MGAKKAEKHSVGFLYGKTTSVFLNLMPLTVETVTAIAIVYKSMLENAGACKDLTWLEGVAVTKGSHVSVLVLI